MPIERAVPKDDPLMQAWKDFMDSERGQNVQKWAGTSNVGNLWAAFLAGWEAAGGKVPS